MKTDDQCKKEANEDYLLQHLWYVSYEKELAVILSEEIRKEVEKDILQAMKDFLRKKTEMQKDRDI